MSVPFISTDSSISIFLDGNTYTVNSDHWVFSRVKEALSNNDVVELQKLLNQADQYLSDYVNTHGQGTVEYRNGEVYLNRKVIHNELTNRVKEYVRDRLPFEHLLSFLRNLNSNPSYQSQKELFDFLSHHNLPITDDGCFLAYKAVTQDNKDIYSKKIDNSVGQVVSMSRGSVDDDRNRGCSYGFHAGTLEYARNYGGCSCKMMVVKINPKDVVSVPTDCSCQKLRTCSYEVLKVCEGALTHTLYDSLGSTAYVAPKVEVQGNDYDIDDEYEWNDYDKEDVDEENWDEQDKLDMTINNNYGYHGYSKYWNKRDQFGRFCK